ncbi:MAG: response regulator [bacterium]
MKKILVVDDEEAFRKAISLELNESGYEILEANDGMEGLEQANRHLPDLIITDVQMDNMNGFVMVEELRQNEATSLIPIIFMTGAMFTAGAWKTATDIGYLEKPFSIEAFKALVEKMLKL